VVVEGEEEIVEGDMAKAKARVLLSRVGGGPAEPACMLPSPAARAGWRKMRLGVSSAWALWPWGLQCSHAHMQLALASP
jgi:hypothetical protein